MVVWVGVWCGGVEGDEDNIPDERVVCHPPARAPNPPARARRGTKTWNMNFWPLTLSMTTMMRMRVVAMMIRMLTMTVEDDDWKFDHNFGCRQISKEVKRPDFEQSQECVKK